MYKKNKKQLAHNALKYILLIIIAIALMMNIDSIINIILPLVGNDIANILKGILKMSLSLLCIVGTITFGVSNIQDIFGYLVKGREKGSVTKEELDMMGGAKEVTKPAGVEKKGHVENKKTINESSIKMRGVVELSSKEEVQRHLKAQKGR